MQIEPILHKGRYWNKDKHCLKLSFLAPLSVKMTIADCFTCLCSVHLFVGAGNYRGIDSKQSSVKCREGLEKSHHCLHLTSITKATWRVNKVRKKNPVSTHMCTRSYITSAYDESPSCLILIANMSQKPGPPYGVVVFRVREINSHCAAVVMSQMKTALTWAWTHQLKWSCSLSCRRQTIGATR